MAIGEELAEQGRHALIVIDDLSKHAQAYRQVSLLLSRLPGRGGVPRRCVLSAQPPVAGAARLADEYGGGQPDGAANYRDAGLRPFSLYPHQRDFDHGRTGFFFESDLFYAGVRPA